MAEVTAFRNNALPYPVYGVPWTIVVAMLDEDGDPVTGLTCDSEVSINGDTGADCTNEATEIPFTTATNKGMYYLTLTAAEMTGDIITVTIYSGATTTQATCVVLYPRKLVTLASGTSQGGAAGYITLAAGAVAFDGQYNGCLCVATIDTNVEARVLQACTASNQQCTVTPGWNVTPDADDTYIIYLPEGMQISQANVKAISDDATAANNAETAFDGGTYNVGGGAVVAASVTGAVGSVTGAVGSVTGAVGSVTGAVGSVTGAVGSVTGNVGGNVVGSVASVTGAVGSVTGAVGSVTGNVGGNVVGSVASVTGAVGSVTGNVGGSVASVTGAVGSVTGNVGGNVTGSVGSVAGAVASVTAGVTLANGAHGGAGATITLQTPIAATVPDTQKVDVNTIKTQAVTCGAGVTVLASVGTAATSTAQTGDSYAIVNGDHGLVSIQDDMDTVLTRLVGTIAAGTHNAQTGDSYAVVASVTYGLSALKTLLDDVPTVTEFNARTLAAADYFVVTDYTTPPSTSDIKTAIEAAGSHLALILEDTGTTLPATLATIGGYVDCLPATLNGATFTSLPAVTLANGVHGGAAATIVLSDYSDFQGSGGTPLTAQETRDAMKLAPTAGDPAAGSVDKHLDDIATDAATAAGGAVGTGAFAVNHNSGGANALAALSGGAGVTGVTIIAYLTSDYTAGSQSSAYQRGKTTSNDAGGWINSLMLNAGAYTIRYEKRGSYDPYTKTITVASDGTVTVTS